MLYTLAFNECSGGHSLICSLWRQYKDYIIILTAAAQGFVPTSDNVWYCQTLFLFDMEAEMDTRPKEYQCAYVSILEQLKLRLPDMYSDLLGSRSRVIYEHDPYVRYEHACVMFILKGELSIIDTT
jgi:hypothetical protein